MAIQAIYRDLEYARSLIKVNGSISKHTSATMLDDEDFGDIEESWTFVGDESDPELRKRIQDWEVPGEPKVRMSRKGMSVSQILEPIERKGSKSKR